MEYFSRADLVRQNANGELKIQMIHFILKVYPDKNSFELLNASFNKIRCLYNQAKKETKKKNSSSFNHFVLTYDEYNEMGYGR